MNIPFDLLVAGTGVGWVGLGSGTGGRGKEAKKSETDASRIRVGLVAVDGSDMLNGEAIKENLIETNVVVRVREVEGVVKFGIE